MLFILWSATAFVAEVPSGALADRFGRRNALIASGVFQATGFGLWIVLPGFTAFAAGFVLWGFGGALVTGAFEALLYEGLAERNASGQYARIYGWINSVGLLCQIPAAGAATLLFWLGGYDLAGWASIGVCLAASALATRLPVPGPGASLEEERFEPGYFEVLRSGVREALTTQLVRSAVIAAALVGGLDGLEEYFPLMAKDWGLSTTIIPIALLILPLAGAAGASLGGRANRLSGRRLGSILFAALLLLAGMGVLALPAGLIGVAIFYLLHQMILVVVGARLQERIQGSSRATVTSVASLGTEVVAIALFAAWAFEGLMLVAGIWLLVAAALPLWLKEKL